MGKQKIKRPPVFKDKKNENTQIVSGLPRSILRNLEINEQAPGSKT
jgi:hypothetical protein